MPIENYEEAHVYPLDPEVQEQLFKLQNECSFIWGTKDHWAVGVIMNFVWRDGRFWLTATSQRHAAADPTGGARHHCDIVPKTLHGSKTSFIGLPSAVQASSESCIILTPSKVMYFSGITSKMSRRGESSVMAKAFCTCSLWGMTAAARAG